MLLSLASKEKDLVHNLEVRQVYFNYVLIKSSVVVSTLRVT